MKRLLGYVRVSTDEQGESGLGLEAQKAAIKVYCHGQGYDLADTVEEVGSTGFERPKLESAIQQVIAGDYDGIIAAKLDRFCRSVVEANEIVSRLDKANRTFIALDLNVDTSTAVGRAMLNMLATFAQWERETIGERTRNALAAKKARGEKLGRARVIPDRTRRRAQELRSDGATYGQIIKTLTAEGHKTAGGGPWQVSTIQRLLAQPLEDGPPVIVKNHGHAYAEKRPATFRS